MEKLSEIYYQPNHLWIRNKAVKKLKELTDLKSKEIKSWLAKQAFWQAHLRRRQRKLIVRIMKLQNQTRCINLICFTCPAI